DALRMNMMISYQELVRTFPRQNQRPVIKWLNNITPDVNHRPSEKRSARFPRFISVAAAVLSGNPHWADRLH
ncbi:hypothetical protein, partial [Serratia marcescens]|uniref:hypothetical protein n=1 Tax=Serratia marcescens TaxID=615 RepID=UPI001F14C0EC